MAHEFVPLRRSTYASLADALLAGVRPPSISERMRAILTKARAMPEDERERKIDQITAFFGPLERGIR